jgi:hypothetical protein
LDGKTLYTTKTNRCTFCHEEENSSQWWDIEYKDNYYFFVNCATKGVITASPDKNAWLIPKVKGS